MRKWIVLLLAALLALPSFAMATPTLEEIQEELEEIQDRLDAARSPASLFELGPEPRELGVPSEEEPGDVTLPAFSADGGVDGLVEVVGITEA